MLQITSIEVQNVNYKISQEGLRQILKHSSELRDYTCKERLVDVISYIIDDFDEEVKIGTFHDINDYIEYFIERCREIY